jgi:hypothetical protein
VLACALERLRALARADTAAGVAASGAAAGRSRAAVACGGLYLDAG